MREVMTIDEKSNDRFMAVVDVHSINNDYWLYDSYFCGGNPSYNKFIEIIYMDAEFRNFLLLLEASVIFEHLIVDGVAYHKIINSGVKEKEPPSNFLEVIDFRDFSDEIYFNSLLKTQDIVNKIYGSNKDSKIFELYKLQYSGWRDPFWDGSKKLYMDKIGYGFSHKDHRWLTDSNNSLGRAVFYLEVSSIFNTPIYLSSQKADWLSMIGTAIQPSIHERLVKLVDSEIKQVVPDFLNNLPMEIEIPVSPIIELIIKKAKKDNCCFSEAALAIRELESANDYRKFLLKLNLALSEGRGGYIKSALIIKDLRIAISQWVEHLDLDLEITRRRRRIKFEKLPLIGTLLCFFDLSDVEIKDYILKPVPGYLAFIASWYGWKDRE